MVSLVVDMQPNYSYRQRVQTAISKTFKHPKPFLRDNNSTESMEISCVAASLNVNRITCSASVPKSRPLNFVRKHRTLVAPARISLNSRIAYQRHYFAFTLDYLAARYYTLKFIHSLFSCLLQCRIQVMESTATW